MTDNSYSSSHLRRQPKQQRGKDRVDKILNAAAEVFDQVGYEAATTHQIAAQAGTAVGSLYQFFPNKAAIFNAMELRHIERVKTFWSKLNTPEVVQLPLQQMMHQLITAAVELFEHPVSRIIFIQFYTSQDMFQSIDESMTQEAINFLANILRERNPSLPADQCHLLAEVSVHSSNAVILSALRTSDVAHRQRLTEQIESLLTSYLEPHVGVPRSQNVMKVMTCPHCQSDRLSKNGKRRNQQCYVCKDCRKQFVESVMLKNER
ncbi:TetR/AcrR family transcriptional regulator [Acaryochloris sp. CCMEE 5410]|uniref:TetR/AcrR family transcriptional regulator n=1 Tax=Acaryochloris sp. CCMEE 5410 TaxID=310037 RepID=UPI000302850F|nr:TetR/AcrR family transcriptional regulator [Acaryochloris sp. CCMEE 5410]KAI9132445.1 TetR/AcrR family transcriptional regulator [Acaryochloris sp. CCMEE 5410]